MEHKNQPLVSVAVVTYNSSNTVVETLDSIYNQTYPNLELIISDDCSPDNTVEICRDWIESHKDRFVRTELLTVEKNTGVSANMNRAEAACKGEWVKGIAGDDVFLPVCIETYVDFVLNHLEAVCVFANVEVFGGDERARQYIKRNYKNMELFFNMSIEEQYDFLTLVCNPIYAPTAFYNRARVVALGIKNDERIPFEEDRAKWIRFVKAGVHFDFINKATVKYRLSDTSLCRDPKKHAIAYAQVYIYYCFHNDCKKRGKKKAILKWIRAQRTIHDNAIIWRVICKLYRVLFNVK